MVLGAVGAGMQGSGEIRETEIETQSNTTVALGKKNNGEEHERPRNSENAHEIVRHPLLDQACFACTHAWRIGPI